jgi:hypothetical protein
MHRVGLKERAAAGHLLADDLPDLAAALRLRQLVLQVRLLLGAQDAAAGVLQAPAHQWSVSEPLEEPWRPGVSTLHHLGANQASARAWIYRLLVCIHEAWQQRLPPHGGCSTFLGAPNSAQSTGASVGFILTVLAL